MNAARKLNETRRAAYAGMGLCVKDAMRTHTEWADRVRTVAQDAGVHWDLVCREYATGATGGAIVIATFTPADGDREVAVIIDRADNDDEIRAKVIAANGTAVTATGRPYRHAASPESLAKLRVAVDPGERMLAGNNPSIGFDGTMGCLPLEIWVVLHPDGSVTWSKA